jgi:hypothetical protein
MCIEQATFLQPSFSFFPSMDEPDMNFKVIISVQLVQEALRKCYLFLGPQK